MFKKIFYYVILLTISVGCVNQAEIVKNEGIFQKAKPIDSLSFYFPAILNDTFVRKNPDYRNFEQNWFSSTLYSLKEPIIYKKNDSQDVYRLLWIRSFHQPVSFTMTEFKNQYYLHTKMLDCIPAFYPTIVQTTKNEKYVLDTIQKANRLANIIFDQIIRIDKGKWNSFELLLKENNFWKLNTIDTTIPTNDGSEWILEGYKNGKYHFVVRQNAKELRQCGEYLIDVSNLEIKKDHTY